MGCVSTRLLPTVLCLTAIALQPDYRALLCAECGGREQRRRQRHGAVSAHHVVVYEAQGPGRYIWGEGARAVVHSGGHNHARLKQILGLRGCSEVHNQHHALHVATGGHAQEENGVVFAVGPSAVARKLRLAPHVAVAEVHLWLGLGAAKLVPISAEGVAKSAHSERGCSVVVEELQFGELRASVRE